MGKDPMLPNQLVIESSDRDLLRNVLNEVLNGFAIQNFEGTIGNSRSELENLFEYFNDHSAHAQVQLTGAQASAVLNALCATLRELGSEEFHTRTGFDFAESEIVLQRLTRLLHGRE